MRTIRTELPECIVIEPAVHGDARGYFYESFHAQKFAGAGLDLRFVQTNVSRSARGVLRGAGCRGDEHHCGDDDAPEQVRGAAGHPPRA